MSAAQVLAPAPAHMPRHYYGGGPQSPPRGWGHGPYGHGGALADPWRVVLPHGGARRSATHHAAPYRAADAFGVRPGDTINGRWRVIQEAGRGNFARVVSAEDTMTGGRVAVKMLRREYADDARAEAAALKAVAQRDPEGRQQVVRALGIFQWEGLHCFVMPLLGPALSTRRLGVRRGVTRGEVVRLARQLAEAMCFLHNECRLVHTDLKPENILLDAPCPTGLGRNWIVADLGSSSFHRPDRMDSDLITTRPYRAVEVVMKRPWSCPADMWSLGCIVAEVWSGERLFDVPEDAVQLQAFVQRIGDPPAWLQRSAAAGRQRPPAMRPLSELLAGDAALADLVRRLLHYDPQRRMSAGEMCRHPFVSDTALHSPSPSDGGAEPQRAHGGARRGSSSAAGEWRPVPAPQPARPAQPQREAAPGRHLSPQRPRAQENGQGETLLSTLSRRFPDLDCGVISSVVQYVEMGRLTRAAAIARLDEISREAA